MYTKGSEEVSDSAIPFVRFQFHPKVDCTAEERNGVQIVFKMGTHG